MKSRIFILLLIFSCGCAFIPQEVKINPQVAIEERNIGRGKKVFLKVTDERTQDALGRRGTVYGGAAEINTSQDIVGVFVEKISEGLKKKGFNPEPAAEDSQAQLKVEIRAIDYSTEFGIWTGGNLTKTALKVVVQDKSKIFYEKTYRGENEIRTAFVASQETNAKIINNAVADVLNKMFADEMMLESLIR